MWGISVIMIDILKVELRIWLTIIEICLSPLKKERIIHSMTRFIAMAIALKKKNVFDDLHLLLNDITFFV